MQRRNISALIFASTLFGCAAPELGREELQTAWKQTEFERGKLPIGRVIAINKFDIETKAVAPDFSQYAGLVPMVGLGAVLVVMHLTSPTPIRAGYRHTLHLEKDNKVITFDLVHPYTVGDCLALRTGLDSTDLQGASPVLALPGACAA
jgi:hypothetical protein